MQKGCHEQEPVSLNGFNVVKGTITCLNLDNCKIFLPFIFLKKKVLVRICGKIKVKHS